MNQKLRLSMLENQEGKKYLILEAVSKFIGPMKNRVGNSSKLSEIEGLKYQQIPGDGHCLYHAVGLYLGENATFLRKIVAAYLEEPTNLEHFKNFMELAEGQTVTEYVRDIRKGKEWAFQVDIEVLMRVLNRPIIIIGPDNVRLNPGIEDRFSDDPIFVYYKEEIHYDALLLTDKYKNRSREIIKKLVQPANFPSTEKDVPNASDKETDKQDSPLDSSQTQFVSFFAEPDFSPNKLSKAETLKDKNRNKITPYTDSKGKSKGNYSLVSSPSREVQPKLVTRERHNSEQLIIDLSIKKTAGVKKIDSIEIEIPILFYENLKKICKKHTPQLDVNNISTYIDSLLTESGVRRYLSLGTEKACGKYVSNNDLLALGAIAIDANNAGWHLARLITAESFKHLNFSTAMSFIATDFLSIAALFVAGKFDPDFIPSAIFPFLSLAIYASNYLSLSKNYRVAGLMCGQLIDGVLSCVNSAFGSRHTALFYTTGFLVTFLASIDSPNLKRHIMADFLRDTEALFNHYKEVSMVKENEWKNKEKKQENKQSWFSNSCFCDFGNAISSFSFRNTLPSWTVSSAASSKQSKSTYYRYLAFLDEEEAEREMMLKQLELCVKEARTEINEHKKYGGVWQKMDIPTKKYQQLKQEFENYPGLNGRKITDIEDNMHARKEHHQKVKEILTEYLKHYRQELNASKRGALKLG